MRHDSQFLRDCTHNYQYLIARLNGIPINSLELHDVQCQAGAGQVRPGQIGQRLPRSASKGMINLNHGTPVQVKPSEVWSCKLSEGQVKFSANDLR